MSISPEYELEGYSYYDTPTGPAFVRNDSTAGSAAEPLSSRRRPASISTTAQWHPYATTTQAGGLWGVRGGRPLSPYTRQSRSSTAADTTYLTDMHAAERHSSVVGGVRSAFQTPPGTLESSVDLDAYLIHDVPGRRPLHTCEMSGTEGTRAGRADKLRLDVTGALRGTMHSFINALESSHFEPGVHGSQQRSSVSPLLELPSAAGSVNASSVGTAALHRPLTAALSTGSPASGQVSDHTWLSTDVTQPMTDLISPTNIAADTAALTDSTTFDFSRYDLFEYGPFDGTDTVSPLVSTVDSSLPAPGDADMTLGLTVGQASRPSIAAPAATLATHSMDHDRPMPQVSLVGGYHAPGESPLETNERGGIRIERLVTRRPSIKYEIPEDVTDMTVAQLKTELRNRGLQATGKKEVLQTRLLEARRLTGA